MSSSNRPKATIAILDDDELQLKVIERKLKIFTNDLVFLTILTFKNTKDFLNNETKIDYYVLDYDLQENRNGIDMIKTKNIEVNATLFTGSIHHISQEEKAYLNTQRIKLTHKPNIMEVAENAICYILPKTVT